MTPAPPLAGSWKGTLLRMSPYTIHSDRYFELAILLHEPLGPPTPIALRTSAHAVNPDVQQGGRVEITFLLGQVTAVKAIEE